MKIPSPEMQADISAGVTVFVAVMVAAKEGILIGLVAASIVWGVLELIWIITDYFPRDKS